MKGKKGSKKRLKAIQASDRKEKLKQTKGKKKNPKKSKRKSQQKLEKDNLNINKMTGEDIIKQYVTIRPFEKPNQKYDTIKEKVFLSPHGIGIGALARALRSCGVHATACSFSKDAYSYLSDVCLNLNLHPKDIRIKIRDSYFKKALETFDIFQFRFGATFFRSNSRDLKILNDLGKKIIIHHCGSDARLLSVARSFNNPYVQVKETWPEEKVHAHMKLLSTFTDHVIINDHELMPYVKKYYKHVHVVPYTLNVHEFTPKYPDPNVEPIVVHAPSNRGVKGTEFVLAAVDRLKKEGYKFQFKLIENLTRPKAMELYQKSTIVVDQLTIGTYANLSMEAMAMGKPVICYIREDLRNTFPRKLPIVSANPDTIYKVLKDLLNRPQDWNKLGKAGRKYVEKNHNYEKVAKMLIDVYKQI